MALIKSRLALLAVVSGIMISSLKAQTCLDDYCYLTTSYTQDISVDINAGYRVFFLESAIEDEELLVVRDFLKQNPKERIILIVRSSHDTFHSQLVRVGLVNQLFEENKEEDMVGMAIDTSDQLVVFSENQDQFLSEKKYIRNADSGTDVFEDTLVNHITYLSLSDTLTVEEGKMKIKNLISQQGKLPNFLKTDRPKAFESFLDSLNQTKWYRAIVLKDKKFLKETNWKELPALKSSGKIHVTTHILSPEKAGYRFSPDVSTYTDDNANVVKVFNASHLEITEGLIMSLNFDNNVINQVNHEDKYLYEHIAYDRDEERGVHAKFDGHSHYIDFGVPSDMDFREITVSAWVNPDTLNGNKSVVGIGEVLSAKFREGKLTFTTPAIKDHETDSILMKTNEWQHVAFVYKENKDVDFYHNGVHVGRLPASDMTITSHSLLVGSNLWSEYFQGGMDDLYIWDRALSGREVLSVYEKGLVKSNSRLSMPPYWSIAIVLVGFVYLFWRKKTKKKQDERTLTTFRPEYPHDNNQPGVYLFGGFKLINREGKDLSSLFSPKRKELFVLMLLYTFRSNGISSKQMSEILWEGHSFESAKNNRSTQMKRIREILMENTGVSVDYDQKNWKVKMSSELHWDFSDYFYFKNELKKDLDRQTLEFNINRLLDITNQGVLLPNMHYEWLDPIKGQLTEEIIEILTQLLENEGVGLDTSIRLKLTNTIFSLDPLNEQALTYKIKILIATGKHTLAKNVFDQFSGAYQQFYGEVYDKEFARFH